MICVELLLACTPELGDSESPDTASTDDASAGSVERELEPSPARFHLVQEFPCHRFPARQHGRGPATTRIDYPSVIDHPGDFARIDDDLWTAAGGLDPRCSGKQ